MAPMSPCLITSLELGAADALGGGGCAADPDTAC